jgi:hypothetical protein
MDARPVEWAEPKFYNFIKIATDRDRAEVRSEIDRIEAGNEDSETRVPFSYPQKSYLVVVGKWRIILEDRDKIWFLTHIDNKME